MIQLDILSQITFVIIICFSFLIFTFTISMNRKKSLSKALGLAFILPFSICVCFLLFLKHIPPLYIFWFCEMTLSVFFFISVFLSFNNKKIGEEDFPSGSNLDKNYDLTIIIIFVIGVCSYFLLKKVDELSLYLLSHRSQTFISIYIISVNLILIKYRKFQVKSLFWGNTFLLISSVLNFFEYYNYSLTISIIFRFFAYLSFYDYVYKETYNGLMSKIEEANKLKQRIDRSVNKEVKKQLLHYEIAKEKLLIKSKTDSLTKAYNKEAIINIIDEMIQFKKDEKFAVMMFDIDNFKYINDTFGHITGDVCIKNLVNTTRNCIRKKDLLGRFGGDEFVIVLPGLDIKEAKLVAERIRENVSLMSNPKFTISIGISVYPKDGNTVNRLISLADEGLYISKEKGKNMVSHANLF